MGTKIQFKKPIDKHYGLVCLLDALGAKTFSLESAEKFLSDIDILLPTLDTYIETYFRDEWGGSLGEDITAHYNAHPLEIYPFGDTILVIWDLTNHPKPDVFLLPFANIASFLIILALDKGIVFRGAMTIGHYIQNENIVIGPAIADAASWYERANQIGIIVTPYCGQFISSIYEDIPTNLSAYPQNYMGGISLSFLKCNVPLKGDTQEALWTINWPSLNGARMDNKSAALKWYYDCIKKVPIPFGTEGKYRNTENYYRSSCDVLESRGFWKDKAKNQIHPLSSEGTKSPHE